MILDTCALLWLASGDQRRLSKKTLAKIDKALNVSVVAKDYVGGRGLGIYLLNQEVDAMVDPS